MTSDYGYMIVDRLVSFADYLNCPNATLTTWQFHMRDGRGRYVNLYNNHISFTIVFDTKSIYRTVSYTHLTLPTNREV